MDMPSEEITRALADALTGGMTCRELVELVTDYVEGDLSRWNRVRCVLHLGLCQGCRAYLRQVKETLGLLSRLPVEPAPETVKNALVQVFRMSRIQAP